jgi:D-alanyl-D-alanine dipeptidase
LTIARQASDSATVQRTKTARLQQAIAPVRTFTQAWRSVARIAEKDAAEHLRSDLETIAQRQLGLVTDNAITPAPEKFVFHGVTARSQKITLRASGKDLSALLAWLGKVEEKYPAAIVEQCDFSSNVGGNTGLTIRLVQALGEPADRRRAEALLSADSALLPEAIAAFEWDRYRPSSLKMAVPVGFARNPLQPAIIADCRPVPTLRDEADEITPRVEMALDSRLRSVIRGAAALVVIDGRVFRVGDEVVIGSGRDKLIHDTKTKLKNIGDDRLVFQVTGGTSDHPIQCDVTYDLPSFLRAR